MCWKKVERFRKSKNKEILMLIWKIHLGISSFEWYASTIALSTKVDFLFGEKEVIGRLKGRRHLMVQWRKELKWIVVDDIVHNGAVRWRRWIKFYRRPPTPTCPSFQLMIGIDFFFCASSNVTLNATHNFDSSEIFPSIIFSCLHFYFANVAAK